MRKNMQILLTVAAISVAALAVTPVAITKYKNRQNNISKTKNYIGLEHVTDSSVSNLYKVTYKKSKSIYDETQSAYIYKELQNLKANGYTVQKPLAAVNPFGTNDCSMYLAFQTEDAVSLEYTIHVDDKSISDFTRKASILSGDKTTTEHEYQLIGLIPGMENEITLNLYAEDGSMYEQSVFTVNMPETDAGNNLQIKTTDGNSRENLTSGLYAVFPTNANQSEEGQDVICYDNNGTLRSVIPIVYYRAAALAEAGDNIFYAYNANRYALVSPLGQVLKTYYSSNYIYHHDYIYNEELNQMWILASDNTKEDAATEDIVISIDLKNGEVKELLDFTNLFPKLKELAITRDSSDGESEAGDLDWIHINSISLVNKDSAIFSSRELSAIIKISGLTSNPVVDYIIADEFIFKGNDASEYLLNKVYTEKEFASQYGQHYVQYIEDSSLPKGSYYLTMYNNNGAWSKSRPDIDWTQADNAGVGLISKDGSVNSYFYKYLVNETDGTYELMDSFAVPYSGIMSNTQAFDTNYISYSACLHSFGEYDSKGNLIRSFNDGRTNFGYRVMKYNFW